MTCADCTAAAADRLHAGFRSGCKGCQARAIARGPHFHRCRLAGKQDAEYRRLLASVGVTHDQVLAAADVKRERAPA
jgi:hypothetical protein